MLAQGIHWDITVDVVVAGYGSAGTVAAITAHDAGANVLILEKQGLIQGVKKGGRILVTNSFLAGGGSSANISCHRREKFLYLR